MKHNTSSNPFSRQASHATHARDAERARVARELHDVLGNTLAALKFESHLLIRALENKLASTPEVDLARILQRSRQINTLLDEAIESTREMVRESHPRVLREMGLAAALETLAQGFTRRTGIAHTVSSTEPMATMDDAQAFALYRVAQEALSNVARHAKATQVVIRLHQLGDGVQLEIADNGGGFTAQSRAGDSNRNGLGFGLSTMRERMLAIDGEFSITNCQSGGTRITCRAPALPASLAESGQH